MLDVPQPATNKIVADEKKLQNSLLLIKCCRTHDTKLSCCNTSLFSNYFQQGRTQTRGICVAILNSIQFATVVKLVSQGSLAY